MTPEDPQEPSPVPADAEAAAEPVEHLGKDRFRILDLQWPVSYQGRVIDKVTIHRLTAREVGEYVEKIRDGGDRARFPMVDVPDEVMDQLDDDDVDAIDAAVMDFLPRRLRRLMDATMLEPGAATSPSSQST